MAPPNADPDQPVSWRAVPEDVPVQGADGSQVGTLHDILASSEEDVFHGIVVQLTGGKRRVFVPADDVTLLTEGHVGVELTAEEMSALPDHSDERVFHLGWSGRFRKRVGWVEEEDR